jgi:hypothetical protein
MFTGEAMPSVSVVKALAFGATLNQQGLWAALTGRAPDVFRLEEVPGISHLDLYQFRLDGVQSRLEARAVNGEVSLQDMIEVKKWVATDTGVSNISLISKGETVLLFLLAGGDKSKTVPTSTVLNIL